MLDSAGALVETLEVKGTCKEEIDSVMVHLVQETITRDGGSVLVFCASKQDAKNAAKLLAMHLQVPDPPDKTLAADDLTRDEALERLAMARPADKLQLVEDLAACVAKGVAYHNSSLNLDERETVQDCFRFAKIRVICCTSTLAAGVNLPARRVIVRQSYCFGSMEGKAGSVAVPLQPAQYQQMAGRAGRTGLDATGESIILAKPNADAAYVAELRKLVLPDKKPLTSALAKSSSSASDAHFKLLVLYAISAGLVVTNLDMQRYVECTLLATLQTTEERAKDALRTRFNEISKHLFDSRLVRKEPGKEPNPVRAAAPLHLYCFLCLFAHSRLADAASSGRKVGHDGQGQERRGQRAADWRGGEAAGRHRGGVQAGHRAFVRLPAAAVFGGALRSLLFESLAKCVLARAEDHPGDAA